MIFRNVLMASIVVLISISASAEETKPVAAPVQKMRRMPADENKDGLLSKSEFLAAQEKRFNEMDLNKDGNLTWDEKNAYEEARRTAKEKKAELKAGKKTDVKKEDNKTFLNRFFD